MGVQVDRMEDMEKLVRSDAEQPLRDHIIDGRSGEILVRGGQFFPELTPAASRELPSEAALQNARDLHRLPEEINAAASGL